MAQAQDTIAEVARAGRVSEPGGYPSPPRADGSDDAAVQAIMDRYDRLGPEPPQFNIARNDAVYSGSGAHTIERHGPDIPLHRDPDTRTIEGRIFGDSPWQKMVSASYQWTDHTTMNREINAYVERNWDKIRSDLAVDEFHEEVFDAHHRIGQGFYNKGMYGAGPRAAEYGETSLVRIRIRLAEGSDPPEPFIVTAFPAGLG